MMRRMDNNGDNKWSIAVRKGYLTQLKRSSFRPNNAAVARSTKSFLSSEQIVRDISPKSDLVTFIFIRGASKFEAKISSLRTMEFREKFIRSKYISKYVGTTGELQRDVRNKSKGAEFFGSDVVTTRRGVSTEFSARQDEIWNDNRW